MKKVLVCWVGRTDLNGAQGVGDSGVGPIAQVADERAFGEIVLLNNYPKAEGDEYRAWIASRVKCPVSIHHAELTSPTDFREIYKAVVEIVDSLMGEADAPVKLTFHLSPGTPAMAAIWLLLGTTKYNAELVESSREQGVKTVSLPFEISADYIPELLKKADSRLIQLSAGLPPEAPEFDNIIHRCEAMKRVVAKARRVALRSVPVLIEGESGTGKELLARAIHKASPRRDNEFVVVNCGAIPSELVESELFGHKKGAFTGADADKKGFFEAADKGTIFLDEIGELPLAAQVKLLRTLQEGEVLVLGTTKPKKVDVRVLAATNRNLSEEIDAGEFRADLFYRLAVAVLVLPPLRERGEDLGLLVDKLLEQVNVESEEDPGYEHKKISASAKNLLKQHTWPGNIRELLNTIRRAAIWAGTDTIQVDDVQEAFLGIKRNNDEGIMGRALGGDFSLPGTLEEVAKGYLERALSESNGNKTQAAKILGISNYQTLTNWLKRYGVEH